MRPAPLAAALVLSAVVTGGCNRARPGREEPTPKNEPAPKPVESEGAHHELRRVKGIAFQIPDGGGPGEKRPLKGKVLSVSETKGTPETSDFGRFELEFIKPLRPGRDLRILFRDHDLVVIYPDIREGRIRLQSEETEEEIWVVRRGDKVYLPSGIFVRFVQELQSEIAKSPSHDERQIPPDFRGELKHVAARLGLAEAELAAQFQAWKLAAKRSADRIERAAAADADKDYSLSARLYREDANERDSRLEKDALLSAASRTRAGDSERAAGNYAAAIVEYKKALPLVELARDRERLDSIRLRLAVSQIKFSQSSDSAQSIEALRESVRLLRELKTALLPASPPRRVAEVRMFLGVALRLLGNREPSNDRWKLYSDSIAEHTAALDLLTPEADPREWPVAMAGYGLVLMSSGGHQGGAEGIEKLRKAVAVQTKAVGAFDIRTRPLDWAEAKNLLGQAECDLGKFTVGEESMRALDNAISAFSDSAKVVTRQSHPLVWADTQHNVGIAYRVRGTRAKGEEAARHFELAVEAHENALTVFDTTSDLRARADAQNGLGSALLQSAVHKGGMAGAALAEKAAKAHRAALAVFKRDIHPLEWARTQTRLGMADARRGWLVGAENGPESLKGAVMAYRAALGVLTRSVTPGEWADAQDMLGQALHALGTWTRGAEGTKYLCEAAAAFRETLSVVSHGTNARSRALDDYRSVLKKLATRAAQVDDAAILGLAAAEYRAATSFFPRDTNPVDWAAAHNNLGIVYRRLYTVTAGKDGVADLRSAVEAFRAALMVFTEDKYPEQWKAVRGNLDRAERQLEGREQEP